MSRMRTNKAEAELRARLDSDLMADMFPETTAEELMSDAGASYNQWAQRSYAPPFDPDRCNPFEILEMTIRWLEFEVPSVAAVFDSVKAKRGVHRLRQIIEECLIVIATERYSFFRAELDDLTAEDGEQ